MEQSLFSNILKKLGLAIMAVALADLVYLNWWAVKSDKSKAENQVPDQRNVAIASPVPTPAESPIASPAAEKAAAAPANMVETKTVVEKETNTIVQTSQKEIFIPIGSGSTFSGNHTELSGLEVTVDTSKYSAIESVDFEASIWVQDGNGKVSAQLFNNTDGHPVWNSEITTSSSSGVLKVSSPINLDSGNKTYAVQAKTDLTSYGAHVDNARIKITLK